jgi:hypothetical protein
VLTVKERGQYVATMRHIHVWLMETLAGWVPTTPEMEVKLLFGEHIWDVAQHADALGKRTFELRMPLQHSVPPADDYLDFMKGIGTVESTGERLALVYDVMLPGIAVRYRRYLGETDSLSDAPTVRILERQLGDAARMISASRALRTELPDLQLRDERWILERCGAEAAIEPLATATA